MAKKATNGSIAKKLVGRTITAVTLRAYTDGRGGRTAQPLIHLDDGSVLLFTLHETESLDTGIDFLLVPAT
jgi:hypothetical protein